MTTAELPADFPSAIRQVKAQLRDQIGDCAGAFADIEQEIRDEVARLSRRGNRGEEIWPVMQYADIAAGTVPEDQLADVRRQRAAPSSTAPSRGIRPRTGTPSW